MTYQIRAFTPAKGAETEQMLDEMFAGSTGMVVVSVHPGDKVHCVALDMDSATAAEILRECALMFKLASKRS